jgi:cyclohexa-1,5-dienecarbonyl-CoA hydratase
LPFAPIEIIRFSLFLFLNNLFFLKEELSMSEYSSIQFEKVDGIARINLNRPPLNVLNIAMMREICEAVGQCQKDTSVKLLVIAGRGKAFSGGVDVADHTANKVKEMTEVFHKMCGLVYQCPQPTLAIVNGHALGGGCELAMCCDMIITSESAKFGQPEIKLGVFPPIAAIILPRIIGRKNALEIILSGELIDANEACRIGLVNKVVSHEKLNEIAENTIEKFAALSAIVLRVTKQACSQSVDSDFTAVLEKVEDIYLNRLMVTKDAEEGLKSFMEKRAPVWRNE